MIFALACIPLITAVGCAVDYSRATAVRAKLLAAADAASVGSIAKASPAFAAAGAMTSDGTIPAGVIDAKNIFDANRANLTGYTLNSVKPTVVKSGSRVTSTVAFDASINTMFLGVIGKSTMVLSGSSTSTANMPLYVDFYLLLDNSPSMGVAATPTDVATMVTKTSDKCAFACQLQRPEQLLQSRQDARRDDADRRAAQRDAIADGHGRRHRDLFEPVSHGDL